MLSYFLIGLSLVLLGIVGFQFSYMFYLDRVYLERRRHIHTLEKERASLTKHLQTAETRVAELEQLLGIPAEKQSEVWADVLDER